jgi:AcrR family transcriptional regulator
MPHVRELSERQTQVLDVVEAVFLRDGLRSVRIGQLTDEAHCSRSTLYELAPSKEELFLLVLDRMISRIRLGGYAAHADIADPVEQLKASMSASAIGLSVVSPVFMEAVHAYPPAQMVFDQHLREAQANLRILVDRAIAAGALRPVDTAVVSELLRAVIDRFTDPDFVRGSEIDVAQALGTFFDILVDGLHVERAAE